MPVVLVGWGETTYKKSAKENSVILSTDESAPAVIFAVTVTYDACMQAWRAIDAYD